MKVTRYNENGVIEQETAPQTNNYTMSGFSLPKWAIWAVGVHLALQGAILFVLIQLLAG